MADADARPRYRCEEGRTCIDVRVKDVAQVFDNRDPMPFLERDLDDEVAAYVTECAADIGGEPFRIVLWAERSELDEAALATAFRKHFEWELARARRRQRASFRSARNGFLLGIALMAALRIASEVFVMSFSPGDLRSVLHEGLVIVSWVALWRPIELVLYDVWPTLERRRLLERIRDAPVSLRLGAEGVHETGARGSLV
ncbi:MAG: hypothetical protein OHK0013_35740 [Sandaracinaceae bacterium]